MERSVDVDPDDRMLAAIVETAVHGFCVIDETFCLRYVNDAMAHEVGRSVEELLGTSGLDLIHPDDRDTAAQAVLERMSNSGDYDDLGVPIPFRVLRPDGSAVVLELGALNLLDHPDVRGVVIRVRPMRGQEHLFAALEEMGRDGPVAEVLDHLVAALGGIIEDGRGLLAVRDPGSRWSRPADVDAALALLVDTDAGGPPALWRRARMSGAVEVAMLDELDAQLAAAGRDAGFAACWVVALPQEDLDACVIIWRETPRLPVISVQVELRRIAEVMGLAIERDRAQRDLEHAARHDQLTGLANRAAFHELLEAVAAHPSAGAGVLFIDLDGFKPVNDDHGHAIGDAVLRLAARRITGAVRTGDTVARLGGDEFAVICAGVSSPSELDAVADRVVESFAAPFSTPAGPVRVGVSVGVAARDEDGSIAGSGPDAVGLDVGDRLLAEADRAMYRVKRAGGRGWVAAGSPEPVRRGPTDA